jgi:hypothetical protein
LAPAAANLSAMALPIPLLPPVIKTVFPRSVLSDILFVFKEFLNELMNKIILK